MYRSHKRLRDLDTLNGQRASAILLTAVPFEVTN
jgi:hypothetical protein